MASNYDAPQKKAEEKLLQQPVKEQGYVDEPGSETQELRMQLKELQSQNDELSIANQHLTFIQSEYSNLYEYAPCGFVTLTPKGIIKHINLKAAALLNIERGPLSFISFSDFIAAESGVHYFNAMKRAEKTGGIEEVEIRLRNDSQNTTEWLHVNIRADNDEKGEVQQWQVSLDDISRRKEAEESLIQTRNMLNEIQRIARIGDVIWNIDSNEILWSDGMYHMLGYDKNEKFDFDRVSSQIHHPDDLEKINSWLENCLKTGKKEVPAYEYRLLHNEGHKLTVLTTGVVEYENHQPTRIIVTIQDITEQKKNEKALRDAYNINTNLLHELQHRAKNSFMTITSMIKVAAHDCKTGETIDKLNELNSRVKAVSELYNMVYMSGSVTEVELDIYLDRVASLFGTTADNITIEKSFDLITVPVKTAIPVGLIVVELLTNATKYAFPEGCQGTIKLSLRIEDANAVINVHDNGPGLPEDLDLEKAGSMGLTLVHSLAEQVGGTLEIEGNGGTRCVLTFPIE